jgi:D-alanyl-D-alanine carboxypeptidase
VGISAGTRADAVRNRERVLEAAKTVCGAFPNEQDAHKKLSIAQTKATQILNHASPLTEAVVKGDNTLYRARFAGLQKDEAEVACRQLKNSEIDCIIIKN